MVNLCICTASYTHISRKEDTILLLEVSMQARDGSDSFVATLFTVGFQNLSHSWCLLLLEVLQDVLTPVAYGSWQLLLDIIPVSSLKCENRPFKDKRKGQSSFIFEMLCGGSALRSRRWRM